MHIIFTDLDGTLLDHDTYSWRRAEAALAYLRELSIPVVFVTSKTRGEVEYWRGAIANQHPFIVENGGAAYIPAGYFPGPAPGAKRGDYHVVEWGTPHSQLVADLREAALSTRCPITAFHELTVEEVADLCELPFEQALLASKREYDEPFLVLDEERVPALLAAIESLGRRWTRGGRFWHILGANDKEVAVRALTTLFEQNYGDVTTTGFGDGLNDVDFLRSTARPVIVRSAQAEAVSAQVPDAMVTASAGPEGWSEAVFSLFAR